MKFYIGQKVICVNASGINTTREKYPPLLKGVVYTILSMKECNCGDVKFNVGLSFPGVFLFCKSCDNLLSEKQDGIWWVSSKRFLPLDDFKAVTFEKISEEVPMGVN